MRNQKVLRRRIQGFIYAIVCIYLCLAAGETYYLLEESNLNKILETAAILSALMVIPATITMGAIASAKYLSKTGKGFLGVVLLMIISAIPGTAMAMNGDLSVGLYVNMMPETGTIWVNYAIFFFLSIAYLFFLWFYPLKKERVFK